MSKKDVLHIPLTPTPPSRDAGAEEEEHPHHAPPVMHPDEGPGATPSLGDKPHIIKPVGTPGRYPGVSVT
jgi:hypothetical protein